MRHGLYRGITMSVAGSDSGGGAGIQADLKTFAALKVFGTTAITAVTVQNSMGVTGVHPIPPNVIEAQILAVGTDFHVDAVKTGMLGSRDAVCAVASGLGKLGKCALIADPVMVAQSGDPLIEDDAVDALLEKLIPMASLVTPNIPEAERLSGISIADVSDMERAAEEIAKAGCGAVLVKGGHLHDGSRTVTDVLMIDGAMIHFTDSRIDTESNHGTGCTLSSAIAAEMASGRDIREAVTFARRYLRACLINGIKCGHGAGCLAHAVKMDWVDELYA